MTTENLQLQQYLTWIWISLRLYGLYAANSFIHAWLLRVPTSRPSSLKERKSGSIFAPALPGWSTATRSYLLPDASTQTFPTVSDQPFIISFPSEVSTSSITGSHLPCSCSGPLRCSGMRQCRCQGPGLLLFSISSLFHYLLVCLELPTRC